MKNVTSKETREKFSYDNNEKCKETKFLYE